MPRWRRASRVTLVLLAAALALLPVSLAITVLLVPLWRRVEESTGIEALGHSGPADWCFWVVYASLLVGAALVALRLRRSGRAW
jgi:TRAP-type C4-dicarboxylate transport system permease small subunit